MTAFSLRIFMWFWALSFFLSNAEAGVEANSFWFAASVVIASLAIQNLRLQALVTFAMVAGFILLRYPVVANHSAFMMWTSLFALPLLSKRENQPGLSRLFLYSLCAIYLWSAVHKMNAEFFTPHLSCAVTMAARWEAKFGLSFVSLILKPSVAPVIAVTLEIMAPLFLVFRATRFYGVLLALALHLFLAPIGFLDFTMLALAVIGFALAEDHPLETLTQKTVERTIVGFVVLQLILGALIALKIFAGHLVLINAVQSLLIAGLAVAVLIQAARAKRNGSQNTRLPRQHKVAATLSVSWILMMGTFNYLGLATSPTFSMFSNLRTEGDKWNHYFIPKSVKIFGLQEPIYWVVSVKPELIRTTKEHPVPGYGINKLEIERITEIWNQCGVTESNLLLTENLGASPIRNIEQTGVLRETNTPWLIQKLFYFRRVPPDFQTGDNCRW